MKLFDKEKDWILKITNAVLLFWLLGAIIVTFNSILDFVMKEPTMTYEEYKASYCYYNDTTEVTAEDQEKNCKNDYNNELYYYNTSDYDKTKNLIISAGNVVIVVGFMMLLNRKKKGKK